MDHTRLLNISIEAAESGTINEGGLEFYWYGPWNTVLTHWFQAQSTVIPQYIISCMEEDRDGNKKPKTVRPDFVVSRYYINEEDMLEDCIELIVENKRSTNKDLEEKFKDAIRQLEDQISTLFKKGGYKYMYGIVAIGKYWRWYRYNFIDIHTHNRTWSNESYRETKIADNYKMVKRSPILDISSGTYCNDFKALMRDMRRQ